MRRVREDHLHQIHSGVNERPLRCGATLTQPKAGVAACLAMIPPALKKQPVQPQPQAMGAARRDPRRGESPVGRCQAPVRSAARQSGK